MEAQDRSTTPPKAKRQLTEAQLTQLAKAREKANAVRKQNAQLKHERKKKEQRLKELQRKVQEEEIDEEIQRHEQINTPSKSPAVTKKKPGKPKAKPKAKTNPVEYDSEIATQKTTTSVSLSPRTIRPPRKKKKNPEESEPRRSESQSRLSLSTTIKSPRLSRVLRSSSPRQRWTMHTTTSSTAPSVRCSQTLMYHSV